MSTLFQGLVERGFEVRYKPVKPSPKPFEKRTMGKIRASLQDIVQEKSLKLVDVRSRDEFTGKLVTESRAGHLPGAINFPWTEFLGTSHYMLKPNNEIVDILEEAGFHPSDKVVTYCSYGPRAALAYLALRFSGYKNVRVYDGSFHQWALRNELPVEV